MELDAHGLLDEWVGGIPKGTDFDRHGSDCELGRRDSRIQIFYIAPYKLIQGTRVMTPRVV